MEPEKLGEKVIPTSHYGEYDVLIRATSIVESGTTPTPLEYDHTKPNGCIQPWEIARPKSGGHLLFRYWTVTWM